VDRDATRAVLEDVREGRVTVGEALERLRFLPFEDLGFAKADTHRALRRGFPETVYAPGKTPLQVVEIVRGLRHGVRGIMVTRVEGEAIAALEEAFPEEVRHFREARLALVGEPMESHGGRVVVVSAGTSDSPVAEEAAVTAELLGATVERLYDVGVSGVHRLAASLDLLARGDVIVAVAGMEGALPSVVAGMVDSPVVAVPTSVGYGATFDGLAALLGMMSSCSPGLAVVNIDNGFGAGYYASLVAGQKRGQPK
jgi:NCAIR mutase (PurE)-related protein